MLRVLSVLSLALAFGAGCQALLGIPDETSVVGSDASATDASSDTSTDASGPDAPPDPGCPLTSTFFNVASIGTPGPELQLNDFGTYLIDTDAGTLTPSGESPVPIANSASVPQGTGMARVVFVESLDIGANAFVRAVGQQSLILAACTTATISGTIDVSSSRDGAGVLDRGAGADVFCGPEPQADGAENLNSVSGGSGGAGGSAAQRGGDGGDSLKGFPEPGGTAGPTFQPTAIRGGCPGGRGIGMLSIDASDIGEPGSGGGGVLVTAGASIDISGRFSAGGAGGSGAADGAGGAEDWAGGGGGGSGGLIVLEADQIDIRSGARLFANGGGGGGAAVHDLAAGNGGDAQLEAATVAAGGAAAPHGHSAPGGAGGFASGAASAGSAGDDSGGGGGGGVGYIHAIGSPNVEVGVVISPALSTN